MDDRLQTTKAIWVVWLFSCLTQLDQLGVTFLSLGYLNWPS